jgi:cobalt/nickel transport system permease protein
MLPSFGTQGTSALHRADPRVKLLGLLPLALVLAVVQQPLSAACGLVLGGFFYCSTRPAGKDALKSLAAVNVFTAFLWIVLPPTYGGEAAFHLGPLPFSRRALLLCALITLKSNALLFFFVSLLGSSSPAEIGLALQRLGAPRKLSLLLVFSYRAIFETRLEFLRLQRAASMRCFRPRSNAHTYRSIANLLAVTLLRSHDRAEQVHKAMLLRGWDGNFRSLREYPPTRFDSTLLLVLLLAATGIAYLDWSL